MQNVLFFISDYSIGMTSLLCQQAISLNETVTTRFHFISGDKEQVPGLRSMLIHNNIDPIIVQDLDDHNSMFAKIRKINKHICSINPGYVHVQNNWQLALVFLAKSILFHRFKIIYTIHGYRHNYRFRSFVFRYLLIFALMITAHKVVAASSFVKNKFKFIKKRVVVIYLGVEDCFFLPGSIPSLNTASISIIFAGQFREGKNQEKLIRAFHQFLLRSQNNSFNLTLPGDGNQRETCRNLVRAINLEKRIFFPGQLNRQEICDLYAKSNISVIPSNVETFGHCIAEPFVLGLCVITSDTGIASDLISDGENGFIFKDFNELVDILVKLDANHDLITQTGQNAYSGHDQLRWQSITEKMVQLYA